jgi:hypothetical protein
MEVTPCLMRMMPDGEVLAVFPTQAGGIDPNTCGCYAHVGQHSACHPYPIVGRSRPATPAEYADLQAELEGAPYGYRLQMFKNTRGRRSRWERQRIAQINRAPALHGPVGV